LEVPISLAPKVQRPLAHFHDLRYVIGAARLKQQHTNVSVLSQTTRNHRSGRARSADDKVILRLHVRSKFCLIVSHTLCKLGRDGV
jgi:hypothetical protein